MASSLSLLAMTSLERFPVWLALRSFPRKRESSLGPRLRGDERNWARYSLLAVRAAFPCNSASLPDPDRPNEKDSSMSSGFCLK
jgi:hypothetical protein